MVGERTRLCLVGDSSSIHLRRWAEHFAKDNDILIISDSADKIPGVRVEQLFVAKSGIRNLRNIRRMRKMVREFNPDIVHGHYLTVGGLYASLSGAKTIVGSAWGSDIYYGPRRSFKEKMILKYVLRKCNFVFAGTKDMAERIRDRGYKGEMAVFRFGVDPATFRRIGPRSVSGFNILSIRPCSRIYNPLVILNAFKIGLPQMGNATLWMFDFGNVVDEVHAVVEQDSILKERVRFIPRKPFDEMVEVYNSADVAVSVPDSDSAAASVLEAMACEVPVIASDIPPMREWIEEGATGYLTQIDSTRLADKMRKAYSMRAMIATMGRRARDKVLNEKNQGTFESNIRIAEQAYRKLTG